MRRNMFPEEIAQLEDEQLLDLWEECAWRRDSADMWIGPECEFEWMRRYPEGEKQQQRVETIRKIWSR